MIPYCSPCGWQPEARIDREPTLWPGLGQFDLYIPDCYVEESAFEAGPNWGRPVREAMTDSNASRFAFMRMWL